MALSLTCLRLLYRQHPTFLQCRHSGFIVMLPDVPAHAKDNPLLRSDKFQEFSSLDLRKCYDGIVRRALDFESGFWSLEKHIKDQNLLIERELFDKYLCPIEELTLPLANALNAVKVLRQTTDMMTNEQYHKIHSRAALALENKFTSPLLYYSCRRAFTAKSTRMKVEQRRLLYKYATFGLLNGMELPTQSHDALLSIRKQTEKHQNAYNNKLDYETKQYKYPISDPHMLKKCPPRLLRAMSDGPDPSKGPWTVRYRTMEPFLEYCPDPLIRHKIWDALTTFGLKDQMTSLNAEVDNIRQAREREANILGFKTYAEYAMQTRMAGSTDNALDMLDHLVRKARPAQAHEIESLNKFAFHNGYHKPLEFWDVMYWQREQLNKTYNVDENDLSAYFPLETVLNGLFDLIKDLFGIGIHEVSNIDVWHRDVRVFEIFDEHSTSPFAHIYLDPLMRPGKPYAGGVALTLRNQSQVGQGQTPQIAIVFNFAPPAPGKPCLLPFSNVVELFKRFGYALQVILSKAAYAEVAGTGFIEVDAVEVPSHFMSHWAFTPSVVEMISSHYETGDKLPLTTLNNLDRIRKHMAGFHLCNEIYKCRLDLEFFSSEDRWKTIMEKLWPLYSAFPLDPMNHQPMSYHELFNADSAAYYADLWSRVIAADIFTSFQEVGLENKEKIRAVGNSFRDLYLSGHGGAAENFRNFRGRDPGPDAFLLSLGLQKPLKSVQPK